MPRTYREKYGKEKHEQRKAEDKAWWDSLDRGQKNWAITRGIANVVTGGSFGRKERLLERAGINLRGTFGGSKTRTSTKKGGKDTDELNIIAWSLELMLHQLCQLQVYPGVQFALQQLLVVHNPLCQALLKSSIY